MNTGATTGSYSCIVPVDDQTDELVRIIGYVGSITGLDWAGTQTLQIQTNSPTTNQSAGVLFVVELVN